MHRTQVILESWQHQALRARAEREGISISALLRRILDRALARPEERGDALEAIAGIGEDTAGSGGELDRLLYRAGESD